MCTGEQWVIFVYPDDVAAGLARLIEWLINSLGQMPDVDCAGVVRIHFFVLLLILHLSEIINYNVVIKLS